MEYSKDIMITRKYSEVNVNNKKKNRMDKKVNIMKKYKLMFMIIMLCISLVAIDFMLITNFVSILQTI